MTKFARGAEGPGGPPAGLERRHSILGALDELAPRPVRVRRLHHRCWLQRSFFGPPRSLLLSPARIHVAEAIRRPPRPLVPSSTANRQVERPKRRMPNLMNQATPDTRLTTEITMTATDSHPTARSAGTVRTTEPTAAVASAPVAFRVRVWGNYVTGPGGPEGPSGAGGRSC